MVTPEPMSIVAATDATTQMMFSVVKSQAWVAARDGESDSVGLREGAEWETAGRLAVDVDTNGDEAAKKHKDLHVPLQIKNGNFEELW